MGDSKELFEMLQGKLVDTCNQYKDGDICLLDAVIYMRRQKAFCERVINDIKAFEDECKTDIQVEAEANNNVFKGVRFEFRNGGRTYDYSNINEIKKVKENLKDLEGRYKSAFVMKEKGLNPVCEETGEVLQLPTVTYRKSSIVVKLPNQ